MAIPKHFTIEGPWKHPGGKLLHSGPETFLQTKTRDLLIHSIWEKLREQMIELPKETS